jgi:transposase
MVLMQDQYMLENGRKSNRSLVITGAEELEIIAYLEACEDPGIRTRLKAILLYANGYSLADVQQETGCSRSSLLKWCQAYRSHGLDGLFDRRRGGNNARLSDEQIGELAGRLRSHSPADLLGSKAATPDGRHWTVEDLCNAIWEWYGIVYKSRTSYYKLLKMCLPESEPVEGDHNNLQDGQESETAMYQSAHGMVRHK